MGKEIRPKFTTKSMYTAYALANSRYVTHSFNSSSYSTAKYNFLFLSNMRPPLLQLEVEIVNS